MRIDFLLCGVQKSGTSAMDSILRQHPQISMAKQKEVHFFDDDSRFQKAAQDYSWYHGFFDWENTDVVRGESTPIYFFWGPSAERVAQYNQEIKCITILRDPIDRAYSHWNMESGRANESRSFVDAVRGEMLRSTVDGFEYADRTGSYLARGMYGQQIRRLWKHLPEQNTLFIRYRDYVNDVQSVMNKIFRFLEVDEGFVVENERVFVQDYDAPLDRDVREGLIDVFASDIRETERLLGWDCRSWLEHATE